MTVFRLVGFVTSETHKKNVKIPDCVGAAALHHSLNLSDCLLAASVTSLITFFSTFVFSFLSFH
jgi:hypothetical protein